MGVAFVQGAFDYIDGQDDGRYHSNDHNGQDVAFDGQFSFLFLKYFGGVSADACTYESSRYNEYGIDEIQVKGSYEKRKTANGNPVSCCTQRRHEGCGNGHTRNDVAFVFGRQCNKTGQTPNECDKHVVDGGRGAGQKFRLRLVKRRYNEKERSREDTDNGSY